MHVVKVYCCLRLCVKVELSDDSLKIDSHTFFRITKVQCTIMIVRHF